MLQKILKYGTVFVVVLCLAITPVLTASAESNTYTFDYSQPQCGDTYGYFEILTLNNGVYTPYLFYYSLNLGLTGSSDVLDIQDLTFRLTVNNNNFVFRSDVSPSFPNQTNYDFDFYLYRVSSSGSITRYSSINEQFVYSVSNESIVGVHSYGNISLVSNLSSNSSFNFIYSGQVDSNLLFTFLDAIYTNSGVTAETIANIETHLEEYLSILEGMSNNLGGVTDGFPYVIGNLELINSFLSSMLPFIENLDISIEFFLENINEYLGYNWYLSYLENLNDYFLDLNDLLEGYFSLQGDLINNTPSGSTSLDEALQGNSSVVPELQGTMSDLDNATENIKDGKTPEDLKEEVGDVLNPDSSILEESTGVEPEELDPENLTIVNQNVFNVVFQSFGGKWLSYLIMCLTISFAAFILGKRF